MSQGPASRGVVWDFGNVLVDWDPFPAIAEGVGEEEARRFLTEFDFSAWNHACDAGTTWSEALARLEEDHPEFSAAGRAYYDHFPVSLVGEVPGTAEIVRTLHAAGVPQFGLTNWSDELYPYAPARYQVVELLHDVVVSGSVGLAKPDPAIYTLLAERIGHPLRSLVFVDDKAANVEAAQALGMTGVVFTDAATLTADLEALGLPV